VKGHIPKHCVDGTSGSVAGHIGGKRLGWIEISQDIQRGLSGVEGLDGRVLETGRSIEPYGRPTRCNLHRLYMTFGRLHKHV
jgi:hypothetical protein